MDIAIRTVDDVTVVEMAGELDAMTAPAAQLQLLSLVKPGCRILLDMTNVSYMSSAGLRMLLSTYRQLSSNNGRIVLVGVAEDIRDTMLATGFLNFFIIYETLDMGLEALQQ
jgi:anti-sigma B factor antagonist